MSASTAALHAAPVKAPYTAHAYIYAAIQLARYEECARIRRHDPAHAIPEKLKLHKLPRKDVRRRKACRRTGDVRMRNPDDAAAGR